MSTSTFFTSVQHYLMALGEFPGHPQNLRDEPGPESQQRLLPDFSLSTTHKLHCTRISFIIRLTVSPLCWK